jgi:integrase
MHPRELPDGERRYDVRWREGGRIRSRTFRRKKDAKAFDAEMQRRAELGAFAPVEPANIPLHEWLDYWWRRDSPTWAASTRRTRSSLIDLLITPYLGSVSLRHLGPAEVRRWRAQVLEDSTPTQANGALGILSAALGAAVADGKLPSNPCKGIKKVSVEITRPTALDPMQVERIRAAMPTVRDAVLWGLMAYAGLRPGEAVGLTWGSVGHVLVIDRSFNDGEWRSTKTGKRRTVEVIAPLAEDLELLRPEDAQLEDLVCPSHAGGPIDWTNWRHRVWLPAIQKAEVQAAPYDGRHTYASLLINEGRPLPYVTAAMGHASAMTTLKHYTHLFDEARLAGFTPMVDAVREARAQVTGKGSGTPDPVRSMFDHRTIDAEGHTWKSAPLRRKRKSGRRDSNPRPSAWKADALAN